MSRDQNISDVTPHYLMGTTVLPDLKSRSIQVTNITLFDMLSTWISVPMVTHSDDKVYSDSLNASDLDTGQRSALDTSDYHSLKISQSSAMTMKSGISTVDLSDIYSSYVVESSTINELSHSEFLGSTSEVPVVQSASIDITPLSPSLHSVSLAKISPYMSTDVATDQESNASPIYMTAPSPTPASSIVDATPVIHQTPIVSLAPPVSRSTTEALPSGKNVSSTVLPVSDPGSYPLIIGLSLCAAGILVFTIILFIVCCRNKKKNKDEDKVHVADLWMPRRDVITSLDHVTEVKDSQPISAHSEDEEKYKVMYPYQAQENLGQVDLEKDDVVIVTEQDANGWWKGRVKEREGWFPGSYVKPVKPPMIEKKPTLRIEIEEESGCSPPSSEHASISSFLISKESARRSTTPVYKEASSNRGSFHLQSRALGKEVSIPHLPNEESVSSPYSIVSSTRNQQNINGTKFCVLYHYSRNGEDEMSLEVGEIVTGIVKERNGWMKGKKDSTNQIGWFPAVYVEKATEQDIKEALTAQFGYEDQQAVYRQLEVNRSQDKDWVGIEHVSTCPYAAENPQDLSFDIGDTIIVYETLENGWWLGSCGNQVGWFPGAYVEMVDESSMNVPSKSDGYLSPAYSDTSRLANHGGSTSHLSVSSYNTSRLSDDKSDDERSITSTGTVDSKKRRPARKAPPPPPQGMRKGSRLPTPTSPSYQKGSTSDLASPRRVGSTLDPASCQRMGSTLDPASCSRTESTPDPKSLSTNKQMLNVSDISKESDSIDGQVKKPEVPRRYIKPKLHKVSRKKINLQTMQRSDQKVKSPPPPRPEFPKNIPKSPLNSSNQNSSKTASNSQELYRSIGTETDVSGIKRSNGRESDMSGVEKLSSINCEQSKDDKHIENSIMTCASGADNSFTFSPNNHVFHDVPDGIVGDLSEHSHIHSTPKVKDEPTLQVKDDPTLKVKDEPTLKVKDEPDFIDNIFKTLDESHENSVSVVSDSSSETKVPGKLPHETSGRIPKYGNENYKSMEDGTLSPTVKASQNAAFVSPKSPTSKPPPPVAPKPLRQSLLQKPKVYSALNPDKDVSSDFEPVSPLDTTNEVFSFPSDDEVLITDGLDSSTNTNIAPDETNTDKPSTSVTPQKPRTSKSRIPKGPGFSPKKNSYSKSEIPKHTYLTSNMSQDSNVLPNELKPYANVNEVSDQLHASNTAETNSPSAERYNEPKTTNAAVNGSYPTVNGDHPAPDGHTQEPNSLEQVPSKPENNQNSPKQEPHSPRKVPNSPKSTMNSPNKTTNIPKPSKIPGSPTKIPGRRASASPSRIPTSPGLAKSAVNKEPRRGNVRKGSNSAIPVGKPSRPPAPSVSPTKPKRHHQENGMSPLHNPQEGTNPRYNLQDRTNPRYNQHDGTNPRNNQQEDGINSRHNQQGDGTKPDRVPVKRKDDFKLTVQGYEAQNEGELSFREGSLVKQISEGSINDSGWFIGMLSDGTSGLIHSSFVVQVEP